MKVVYVSGAYRSKTEHGVHDNIELARDCAETVWRAGAMAFCPQMNSAYMGGVVPDEVFLAGDFEMLSRCDAVYCVCGWRESKGSVEEFELARSLGLPVFESVNELIEWIDEKEDREGCAS